LCEKKTATGTSVLISSKRTFTAKNYGEVPLVISGMRVENELCLGYGFKVLNCAPFQLAPNESKKIEIAFSPDFTLSRVVRTLNFDTSIGANVNFTLIGTVASSALEMCSKNIQRPHWEADFKRNALMVLCVALVLVMLAAAIDSDRILKEHMRLLAREKGPIQPALDLRQIGLETNEDMSSFSSPTHQERLNNLNNHHTSLNSIRKRLTMTKKNDVSDSTSRFNLNKPWMELKNKFTNPKPQNNSRVKMQPEKEVKKSSVPSEDDSVSSTSSKENCEVKNTKIDVSQDSPPSAKAKKKSKSQLNVVEQPKIAKINVKPLNNNQNVNKVQQTPKDVKKPPQVTTPPPTLATPKINGELKSHSPTSNASSNEGLVQNHHHVSFNNVDSGGSDGNGSEAGHAKVR
jgi:hypothetical protein